MNKDVIDMRMKGIGLYNDSQFWTEADKSLIISFFNDGMGITEMALKLGRSEPAIMQQLIKDNMFEHEKRTHRCRVKKPLACGCLECIFNEVCPRSPSNYIYMSCPMEGADS